ncbi:fad binding domain-containing protein [Moniliophthora roreri MCA 2997]|uniref:Fad binding domain-containing protein n=1 Tax=Moniliophthora roreri (strain MCA 2997) TaxID=1381753 RepID=V2WK83_MONRO|nr:fad binding domain-containing protein [Moniliophthora roreri MCA 2997]
MDKNRVLIIGGGPSGLLTAHILNKLSIPYTLFEQDSDISSRAPDWDFGIHWTQSSLPACLPRHITYEKLKAAQVDPGLDPAKDDFLPVFNLSTGEEMHRINMPFVMRLRRSQFMKLLREGLGDVRYGKRLSAINTDYDHVVTATFTDGTIEHGTLLIGTDGAQSVVRNFLFSSDPAKAALKPSRIVSRTVITTLPPHAVDNIRALDKRMSIGHHPGGIFAWFGSHECPPNVPSSKWKYTLMMSRKEPLHIPADQGGPGVLERAKGIARIRFCEPFRSIWEAVPEGAQVWCNRLSSWPTEEWDNRNGRVTLVGDAAHPMLPHRGQGLNSAIQDVARLSECLRFHYHPNPNPDRKVLGPFKKALDVYEKELWKRGRDAVIMSDENAEAVHDWERLRMSPLWRFGIRPVDDLCA